ncbi:MAG TPA: hypothetical protein VF177_16080 [Anaerolineae bacterium]
MKHPNQIRVLEPFIGIIIFGVLVVYLVNVFNTNNWLWFQSKATNVRPSRIIIVDHGQRTILTPGHEGFSSLADAASQALSKLNNSELVNVGLSEETLSDYETRSLVLELYFDSPVHFNTMARIGEPTQLLIPIEGRHADSGLVFLGARGEWWYGAVRMADPTPIYAALARMGYRAAATQLPAS